MTRTLTLAACVALIAALVPAPGLASDPEIIESFQGNAIMQTGGRSSMVTINIYRWSTDDERAEIIDSIKEATADPRLGARIVPKTLRGLPSTGFAFRAGQRGWPFRYSRSIEMEDGTRQIVMATDRPVSFSEAYRHSPANDWDVTVIVLKLDADGNGEGILSMGTALRWNDETNQLEVSNFSSQPVSIGNIRRVN